MNIKAIVQKFMVLSFTLSISAEAQHAAEEVKWSLFRPAEKTGYISAIPISIKGEEIRFKTKSLKYFYAKPSFFRKEDLLKLETWKQAMERDPHQQVIQKVKQIKNLRVLFVGNSYSFNVPKAFAKLAKNKGKKLTVEQVTHGGWTLQKHAVSQKTLDKIRNGNFDLVVLQEQSLIPSFPADQRNQMMDEAVKKLSTLIRESGAIPVFFQTWGRKSGDKQNAAVFPNDTFEAMQKRLIEGYAHASEVAGKAHVVPVGEVWQILRSDGKDHQLYTKDGSHPAKNGVSLSAAAFYTAFYNEPFNAKRTDAADHAIFTPVTYPVPVQNK